MGFLRQKYLRWELKEAMEVAMLTGKKHYFKNQKMKGKRAEVAKNLPDWSARSMTDMVYWLRKDIL